MKIGNPIRMIRAAICALTLLSGSVTLLPAQQVPSNESIDVVPPMVKFAGVLIDDSGKPPAGIVGVTFSLYRDQQGGAPLWMETQNVQPDKAGHYSVMLGSASRQGLTADLFASGEPRWVGVQLQGQAEQARVMLVSVPYAMKAGDATTVGGLPASAFLRATTSGSGSTNQVSSSGPNLGLTLPPVGGGGTTNFIPRWTGAATLGNSTLFQSNAGNIGVGTTTPAVKLDVKGSVDVGGTLTVVPPTTGNSLAVSGTNFKIDTTGHLHFVSSQIFPGTAQLGAANTFADNQIIRGSGSGFSLVVTPPNALTGSGRAGTPALEAIGSAADPNGLQPGGLGLQVQGGTGGTGNILGAGGNGINAFGGTAGNGNGGIGVSAIGGFGNIGDLVETGNGGAGVVAQGGDSALLFGGDGIDATGGAGGQGENFASTSGNGVVGTGGPGGFQEADGSGGFFTGGTAGGFGGFGIEVFAGSDSAAFFSGDIIVTGAISAGTKDFKIDHPLDPANKYLYHASVESSEMLNIYTGNVTTDAQGNAQVKLPDWFEAANTDFRYQLTVIGQFAQAIVSSRVSNHQFAIRTDKPNVDVSWQITGTRQDAFARAHPLVVEEQKNARERGFYLHPELYGAAAEKGIAWTHHPEAMRRVKAVQSVKPAQSSRAVSPTLQH